MSAPNFKAQQRLLPAEFCYILHISTNLLLLINSYAKHAQGNLRQY